MCLVGAVADLATSTIPAARAKNGKAHVVHLAERVRAVLAGLPRLKNFRSVLRRRRQAGVRLQRHQAGTRRTR